VIVTTAEEYEACLTEAKRHPDEQHLKKARAFAREVLARARIMPG